MAAHPIPTIVLSSLDRTLRDLNVFRVGVFRHPARYRSRTIQHDPLRLAGIMYDLKLLPAPSSKVHQFTLTRLEGMGCLVCGGEPVELSSLNRLFTEFLTHIVEGDSGIGSRLDYVEPFIFGAVPVWDGRGIVRGDGYEVDTPLSETTGITEIELESVDCAVQRM